MSQDWTSHIASEEAVNFARWGDIDAYNDLGRKLLFKTTPFGDGKDPYLRYVLCELGSNATVQKFVVWCENLNDSKRVGHPATFGGHYFEADELKQAIDELFRRAGLDGAKVIAP